MIDTTCNHGSDHVTPAVAATADPKPDPDRVPFTLNVHPENIPASMQQLACWTVWRWFWRGDAAAGTGCWTKVPVNAHSGRNARTNDLSTWSNYPDALAAYQANKLDPQANPNGYAGLGFCMSESNLVAGVDFDHCVHDGQLDEWVAAEVTAVDSYGEVSPSGTGVRLFVQGRKSLPGEKGNGVEVYDCTSTRFLTVTGHRLPDVPADPQPRSEELDRLLVTYVTGGSARACQRQPVDEEGLVVDRDASAPRDMARYLREFPPFRRIWTGVTVYPSGSEACMALTWWFLFFDWTPQECIDAWVQWRRERREEHKAHLRYYTLMLEKVARPDRTLRQAQAEMEFLATTVDTFAAQADEPAAHAGAVGPAETVTANANGSGNAVQPPGPIAGDGSKPRVILPGGSIRINDTAEQLAPLLAGTNTVFQRGGLLVRIDRDDNGRARLAPIRTAELPSLFETVAELYRFRSTKQGTTFVPATCSKMDAELVAASVPIREGLPVITVLSRCPVLIDREGQLVEITGYDRGSGILAEGSATEGMSVEEAISLLNDLTSDFRFATPADRTRCIAAWITPALVLGGLLGGRAPVDLGEANDSQAGKGYRNKITGGIYNSPIRVVTQKKGGVGSLEESFDTALLQGANFISLDNIRGKIDSPKIESFLTERNYLARVPNMGGVEIDPQRVLVMATSNKAELTQDLANRSCCVRILKQPEDYAFRQYAEGDLLAHVQARQAKYLGAVHAIIRAWHAAGCPRSRETGHDFRTWAQVLDWILHNIVKADAPLLDGHRVTQQRMASPSQSWLRDVGLAVLKAGMDGQALKTSQIVDLCSECGVEVPGTNEGDNLTDEAVRGRALTATGRKLSPLFQAAAEHTRMGLRNRTLEFDGIEITRVTEYDATVHADVHTYKFHRAQVADARGAG